jgi:hypothetical protein
MHGGHDLLRNLRHPPPRSAITPICRTLCGARICNIFEGGAEIQGQVIGRGSVSGRN